MKPWLADPDVTLWHGDCLEVLRELPDRSVHMCATSPPFYGLRDYGVDGQIGLEDTPQEWCDRLVAVFRECRRVLRDDGTLWVEIGDSYGAKNGRTDADRIGASLTSDDPTTGNASKYAGAELRTITPLNNTGTKPKDLLGQPWMLAFALRADGWYLRSEIIWARPNQMPESVTDRPTKSHSTVFLLSKRPKYFYDADAIREAFAAPWDDRGHRKTERHHEATPMLAGGVHVPAPRMSRYSVGHRPQVETLDGSAGEAPRGPDGRRATAVKGAENSEQHRDGERWPNPSGANARSVWTIPTEPTPFAHFATWPRKLVARMIQAGTSERGCCPECGAPWVRQTERGELTAAPDARIEQWDRGKGIAASGGSRAESLAKGGFVPNHYRPSRTLGWSPSCACNTRPVPAVVLDPFAGSGTTLLVARNHGRHAVGIELNAEYLAIAATRLQQLSLLAEGAA